MQTSAVVDTHQISERAADIYADAQPRLLACAYLWTNVVPSHLVAGEPPSPSSLALSP